MKMLQNTLEGCKDKKNLHRINIQIGSVEKYNYLDFCYIFKGFFDFKRIIFQLFGTKSMDFERSSIEQQI